MEYQPTQNNGYVRRDFLKTVAIAGFGIAATPLYATARPKPKTVTLNGTVTRLPELADLETSLSLPDPLPPAEGALVELISFNGRNGANAKTDSFGNYIIEQLPSGRYTARYSFDGSNAHTREIKIRENTTLNVPLLPYNKEFNDFLDVVTRYFDTRGTSRWMQKPTYWICTNELDENGVVTQTPVAEDKINFIVSAINIIHDTIKEADKIYSGNKIFSGDPIIRKETYVLPDELTRGIFRIVWQSRIIWPGGIEVRGDNGAGVEGGVIVSGTSRYRVTEDIGRRDDRHTYWHEVTMPHGLTSEYNGLESVVNSEAAPNPRESGLDIEPKPFKLPEIEGLTPADKLALWFGYFRVPYNESPDNNKLKAA